MRRWTPGISDERGAAALEFALVFPVVVFIVFALVYGLFAVAAHTSLAHAASRGVRYASLPIDPISGTYPSVADVEAYVDDQTPFFTAASCETSVVGDSTENAPVVLDVSCAFPNPAGKVIGLGTDELTMTGRAEARRE